MHASGRFRHWFGLFHAGVPRGYLLLFGASVRVHLLHLHGTSRISNQCVFPVESKTMRELANVTGSLIAGADHSKRFLGSNRDCPDVSLGRISTIKYAEIARPDGLSTNPAA